MNAVPDRVQMIVLEDQARKFTGVVPCIYLYEHHSAMGIKGWDTPWNPPPAEWGRHVATVYPRSKPSGD